MRLIATTCAVLAAAACIGFAATTSSAALAAQPQAQSETQTEVQPEAQMGLHDHMEVMNDAFRTIKEGYNKPAKLDDVLAGIDTMQQHIVAAKSLVPHKVAEMPAEEQEAARTDYRIRLANLLAKTTELEVALLNGEEELAHKIIRDDLYPMRDEGHDLYID